MGQRFNYVVEAGGVVRATFRECAGLGSTASGAVSGLADRSELTLRRGLANDSTYWEWAERAPDSLVERRDLSIGLLDDTGSVAQRWTVRQARPTSWSAPVGNWDGNLAVEELVLTYESIDVDATS